MSISVCIATYNGEKYIKEQLDSILCQIGENDEIIISDDGSTDKTVEIIKRYEDNRIILLQHKREPKFKNYPFYKVSKNFENALNHASGDLIFLADQDDIWLKEKVATVKQKMGSSLLLLHDCIVVDKAGKNLSFSYFEINKSGLGVFSNIVNCSFLGCCIIIRKKLLEYVLPFPHYPIPHDIWLGLIADWKKKALIIDDKLVLYRRHENNVSVSSKKSHANFTYKIRYRFFITFALMKRMILRK